MKSYESVFMALNISHLKMQPQPRNHDSSVEGCSRPVEHTLLEFGHISNSWTGQSIPPSSGTSFDTLNCESDLNSRSFDLDIELRKSYDYRLYDS